MSLIVHKQLTALTSHTFRAYCSEAATDGNTICLKTGHGYSVPVHSSNNAINIGANWTHGLAIHPVGTLILRYDTVHTSNPHIRACGVAFIALLLSLSTHITVTLLASIASFLAAIITLIAFAIDIALYAYVKHEMKKLNAGDNTLTGPGQPL